MPNPNPPYQPKDKDRAVVQALYANGLTHEQIAQYLRISADTLTKYFKAELETAYSTVLAIISGNLAKQAMAGDKTCMIFWLKTRGRGLFNSVERHEVTGADGKPIVDFGNTADDKLSAIIAAIRASLPAQDGGGGTGSKGN